MASSTPPSTEPDTVLIEAARAALSAIPANDGDHTVTAAARCAYTGAVFVGANVYHFTGGPCAELVVLGTAAAGGVLAKDLASMVAVRRSQDPQSQREEIEVLNPCGRCRQVMLDYNPEINVIVKDNKGQVLVRKVRELLPLAYVFEDEGGDAAGAETGAAEAN